MKPTVSVIIPTYNRADKIARAVNSVLLQTFRDFELVIVDDGSTDNTKNIIDIINDTKIVYFFQKNSGVASARNTGLKHSKGEYIAFLDSDDEWFPTKLQKQVDLFENSEIENLGIIGCLRMDVIENTGETTKSIKRYRGNVLKDLLSGWMSHYTIMNSSVALIKRSVFTEVGIFDEKLKDHEDYDLWVRIAKKYNYDLVPEYLAKCYKWKNQPRMVDKNYAENKMQFFMKNENVFLLYPDIYKKKLFWLASFILRNDSAIKCREILKVRIFNKKFFDIRLLTLYFFTFIGTKNYRKIYKAFSNLKLR